jgi:aspartyl aminopeptidase
MAHAVHPNYKEKHERDHWPLPNKGPVIKLNASQRYASEGETEALFQDVCERSDVPYQKWVNRADLACGSTIGPLTAANLGVRTVDVGCPQLAMHSARELAGALDPGLMVRALVGFLTLS